MSAPRSLCVLALAACLFAGLPGAALAKKGGAAEPGTHAYSELIDDLFSALPQTFDVSGTNPDGTTYNGSAYLYWDPQDGELHIEWQVGKDAFMGSGPMIGGEFIIDWGQQHPAIYRLGNDGNLYGTWANGRGSETLTFAP
ncbi:MAG: hypothetical protein AAF739_16665 [Pseudomonadota bacterium]